MRTVIFRAGLVMAMALAVGGSASAAVTDQKIKDALRFGIIFLKAGVDNAQHEGQAALAGLALLEAGVDPADETIQKIAARIRATAVGQRQTYFLALSIMFLDRMGQEVDDKLIQSMAVRLVAGQSPGGGWVYTCPGPPTGEIQRLQSAVNDAILKGSKDRPKIKPSTSPEDAGKSIKVDPEISDMVREPKKYLDYSDFANPGGGEDNSNTQFAILGLWAARRHGVPVENALTLCERRFRLTQIDGGWFYANSDRHPTPSMTCAGLLGLAIGIGNKHERERRLKGRLKINPDGSVAAGAPKEVPPIADPLRNDLEVQRGYQFLVNAIGGKNFAGGGAVGAGAVGNGGDDLRDNLYLMWSLERVCMTYGWHKLGNVDWHIWGADRLLSRQNADGGWGGNPNAASRSSNVVDTSFAVMFLCRANLVRDLSGMLNRKLTGKPGPGDVKPSAPKEGDIAKNTDPKVPGNARSTGEPQSGEMAKALTLASADKQAALLKEYTDKKGSVYTQALMDAIPELSDEARKAAREALAQRMSRMSADTLRQYLQHDNPEARRAAAYGAAMREEKEMIPDLIAAIGDQEDLVVRAARVALRSLSNNKEDFGPPPGANEGQKKEAMAAWTAWMKKQK